MVVAALRCHVKDFIYIRHLSAACIQMYTTGAFTGTCCR